MENLSTSNLHTDLGRISYADCLDLQMKLVSLRKAGKVGNVLLFLEHYPPVYTIGRKADPKNFNGVEVVKTDRGGDVTYHSPGQLVSYIIFNTEKDGKRDVRKFVHSVEGVIMDTLRFFGYESYVGEEPGIWIRNPDRKVASIGMAIDGNISYHGFALNLTREPIEGFTAVNPCGLDPAVMGYVPLERSAVIREIVRNFADRFGPFNELSRRELMEAATTLS
ncbi:lipoate-protein ligase B [Thermoplasmatales archaeon]|nr:lipoate-protein ligase B [Thermoplasmatales archaeon]